MKLLELPLPRMPRLPLLLLVVCSRAVATTVEEDLNGLACFNPRGACTCTTIRRTKAELTGTIPAAIARCSDLKTL